MLEALQVEEFNKEVILKYTNNIQSTIIGL